MRIRRLPRLAVLVLSVSFSVLAATPTLESIPIPGTKAFPESITSTKDGTLYVGRLGDGGIVRFKPRTRESTIFVQPGALGSRSIAGVFADETSNTLWACSNDLSALGAPATGSDAGSALKAFDLKTGNGKRSVSLAGPHAFCNDITVDAQGSVYVTDSANPTILKLSVGGAAFDVFAQDTSFSSPQTGAAGLDGIAFDRDGNLYVTNYTTGEFVRVEVKKGRAGRITTLSGNHRLQFPDGLRTLGNNSFLLVEGSGTLDRLVIQGETFAVMQVHGGFATPTSVARTGMTAWVSEGNLAYFFDTSKKNFNASNAFSNLRSSIKKGRHSMRFQPVFYIKFLLSLPIALLVAQSAFAQGAHVEVKPYVKVTDERLEHPDAGDWLMYRRTYDGSGYSPLNQITPSNIGRLTLAWSVSTDLLGAHETTAIVNHGRMFITTPQNNVIAFDAKTGTQLWRYVRKYPDGLFQLHPTNRGDALYGDYVYMATTDCALVALDAATGKEVWNVPLDDYKTGCYSTLAPLAVRGKIIVGYSGGELGVRGSVNAFDALTGKRIWKTYTVPAPNEPGGDTWKGETYKRGGGSTWVTGVYDPASNTTYWGTGNPGPWVADDRPGDNLYTDSTLALDADTGKIKSYHQYTPHDSWDWDEVSAPLLIDTEVDGRLTKTATHAGRNGYLWILDRERLNFLHAFPFANNNVFTSIEPKTGRPTVDESKRPGAHQGAEFCPSIGGGKDWPPEAWSPRTKLLYIPANDNICAYLPKGEVPEANSKGFYVGYEVESIFGSVRTGSGASDHIGELQAWDLNTGKRVWQHNFKTMLWSPLLVTGGNILFSGGTPDRLFRAFDARSGKELWSFPLPSGAIGVPTSFQVDGEQYVAVTTGWDLDARGVQNGLDKIQGTNTAVPQAGTLLVFKLR